MLTNFISEATNEVFGPVLTPAAEETIVNETAGPVVVRKIGTEMREARVTDIYDRARVIYLRARRPIKSRAANIL